MYRVNRFKRPVLITTDEVVFHAPTKQKIEPRLIESSIIVAEERFIRPELGWDLYEDICNLKNKLLVTDADVADAVTKIPNADPVIVKGDMINALELFDAAGTKGTRYKDMWYKHLWKIVAEAVLVCALPEGFVQFGAEGSFHNSPPAGLMVTSGQVTPLASSMKWAVDKKVQDRLSPLLDSMHAYICNYKTDYGNLYTRPCPDCNKPQGVKNSGIALDIYDDEDDERCCGDGWFKKS